MMMDDEEEKFVLFFSYNANKILIQFVFFIFIDNLVPDIILRL